MTLSIIASLLLSLVIVWIVAAPFLSPLPNVRGTPSNDGDRDLLLDAKERALRAIKDLELDYSMGKLSSEDFHTSKETLSRELLSVLDRIKRDAGGEQSA